MKILNIIGIPIRAVLFVVWFLLLLPWIIILLVGTIIFAPSDTSDTSQELILIVKEFFKWATNP